MFTSAGWRVALNKRLLLHHATEKKKVAPTVKPGRP